jgi:hypothetical protein
MTEAGSWWWGGFQRQLKRRTWRFAEQRRPQRRLSREQRRKLAARWLRIGPGAVAAKQCSFAREYAISGKHVQWCLRKSTTIREPTAGRSEYVRAGHVLYGNTSWRTVYGNARRPHERWRKPTICATATTTPVYTTAASILSRAAIRTEAEVG